MYNILDYGAIASETQVNTLAIQAAVDACHEAGGGTVHCPPGVFYTGTIWLKSNVTLHLDAGSELKACTDKMEYNALDCFPERDVVAHQNANGTHLILAYQADSIAITGHGRINGNCQAFFTEGKFEHKDFPGRFIFNLPEERPGQMLHFVRCTNVRIQDVAIDNACFWAVYMLGCDVVKISGVSIRVLEVPNGDGLHFSCCRNVIISDCDIDSQDDCLIFRGHYAPLGENIPCENIVVTNCLLKTYCCGFRIGVGDGVIRNCHFANIVIHHSRQGINFMPAYSERYPRGTDLDNINFSNITMDVMIPLYMSNCGAADLKNINFSGLNVTMTQALIIIGEGDNPYHEVTIRDSVFNIRPGDTQTLGGMYANIPNCNVFVANVDDLRFQNCQIRYREGGTPIEASAMLQNCRNPRFETLEVSGQVPCEGDPVQRKETGLRG